MSSVTCSASSAAHALSRRAGNKSGPVPDVSSSPPRIACVVETENRGTLNIVALVAGSISVYSFSTLSGNSDFDRKTIASSLARSASDNAQDSSHLFKGGMLSLAPPRCRRELLSLHHPRDDGGSFLRFSRVLAT